MAYDDLNTGQDLMEYVLAHGGQTASSTDTYATLVKSGLNQAYWSILGWKPWTFAKATTPKVVTTAAKVTATVTAISGTSVTLSATIADTQAGKKWYMDSNQSTYRIAAHTAGSSSLTLDAAYVETNTTGNCTIFQDEYTLATDVLIPHGPLWLRGQFEGEVDLMDRAEFHARYGRNSGSAYGLTEAAAVIRQSFSSGDQAPIIQIAPWTEDRVNIEYEYADRHVLTYDATAATDTPKVPREYRWVIAEWALWLLFRKKSDDAIVPTTENITSGLRLMEDQYLPSSNRSRFHTRPQHGLGFTRVC